MPAASAHARSAGARKQLKIHPPVVISTGPHPPQGRPPMARRLAREPWEAAPEPRAQGGGEARGEVTAVAVDEHVADDARAQLREAELVRRVEHADAAGPAQDVAHRLRAGGRPAAGEGAAP